VIYHGRDNERAPFEVRVHIHIEIADAQLADAVLRNLSLFQHTDDLQPVLTDLNAFAYRISTGRTSI